MPTHHACTVCGHDLSRVRAAPDPHYALPVVVCPACRTAVVRRRDPLTAGWRRACRVRRALTAVLIQTLAFAVVSALAVALISNGGFSAQREYGLNPLRVLTTHAFLLRETEVGPDLLIVTVLLFLLGLFAGAWTRSALNHLRPWWVWLAWTTVPAIISCSAGLCYHLWTLLGAPGQPWSDRTNAMQIPERLTMAALFAAFMLAGFPLARSVRQLWAAWRRACWSKRRRARRRLREDR